MLVTSLFFFSQNVSKRILLWGHINNFEFGVILTILKLLQMSKKDCGKRRNCSIWAISPFSKVFSKDLYSRHVKTRVCFYKQALVFYICVCYKSFGNTVRKGEIARYEQFLLFSQCFLAVWRTSCHFHQIWNCCLQTLSVWKSLKLVVWERVKEVTVLSFKYSCCCRSQGTGSLYSSQFYRLWGRLV